MVKILFLFLFLHSIVYANIFESNCLSCHTDTKELQLFMAKYTLKYSTKAKISKAIYQFLRQPTSNFSIMPYSYIVKYGFKEDSNLSNKNLKKAVEYYYEKYKLQNSIY